MLRRVLDLCKPVQHVNPEVIHFARKWPTASIDYSKCHFASLGMSVIVLLLGLLSWSVP